MAFTQGVSIKLRLVSMAVVEEEMVASLVLALVNGN